MKMPSVGTIGSILLLGGVGYVAYKFFKGDWKLPSLFDGIPIPTPAPETLEETGVVGGVGDIIYNIFQGEDGLRERVTERTTERTIYKDVWRESAEEEAERLIRETTPAGEPIVEPDPKGVFARAVAMTVSEDIHKEGLLMSLLKAPVTIGAGLGAMTQQARYLETLPESAKTLAIKEESQKRLTFQTTPEGIAATALSMPIVTVPLFISDVFKAFTPTPKPQPEPLTQEVVSTVKSQMLTPEGKIRAPFLPSAPIVMKERLTKLGFEWV